jgi:hypothetical protein
VLWNRGQLLVEEEFEVVVIRLDHERSAPQIQLLVVHGMHQPNQFSLISREFGMAGSDRLAAERHRPGALVQDRAKPGPGGVTFHDELAVEIGQLQNRSRG